MIPQTLLDIRRRLGVTQAELAEAIGYKDPMSVSRWERGVELIPRVVALAVQHLICVAKSRRR